MILILLSPNNRLIFENFNISLLNLYFYTHFQIWKKGYTNFGHKEVSMRNKRDRYGHKYIYLIRKQKLSDLANVRPSLKLTNG